MDYRDLCRKRIERLVERRLLSRRDADRFRELDAKMTDEAREKREARISGFHDGVEYRPLLVKVVAGLVAAGEPHAREKNSVLVDEVATMGAGVFLTPWEMTLEYLDRHVGDFADVERAYP